MIIHKYKLSEMVFKAIEEWDDINGEHTNNAHQIASHVAARVAAELAALAAAPPAERCVWTWDNEVRGYVAMCCGAMYDSMPSNGKCSKCGHRIVERTDVPHD